MKSVKVWILALCLLLPPAATAQTKKPTTGKKQTTTKKSTPAKKSTKEVRAPVKAEPAPTLSGADAEAKVRSIISFLEYLLNTLGDANTPASEKDVIVSESYAKVFRDSKVQVEDDLDESRNVITNKDVPAYLKDVDFFFQDAKFEFVVESLQKEERGGDNAYYKVALTRHLSGTTTDGKKVNNAQSRFIEINYDAQKGDLKVASIYTNLYDERIALRSWWDHLSFEWKGIFKKKAGLQAGDSLDLAGIRSAMASSELDLSGNHFIRDVEPLYPLAGLATLNLAGTGVEDLSPLRNLVDLKTLDLRNTPVRDLAPLKYSTKMERLLLSNTQVRDISVLLQMPHLRELKLRKTQVADLGALQGLNELSDLDVGSTPLTGIGSLSGMKNLTQLNLSQTATGDLSPLAGLENLKELHLDSTQVRDVSSLAKLSNLEIVHFNATQVADLGPLLKLGKLRLVYCDRTRVGREQAEKFRTANPKVLIIFDSEDLSQWWNGLSKSWQASIMKTSGIRSEMPSREELATITRIDSLNIGGISNIDNLEPVKMFANLEVLIASNTGIAGIAPLRGRTGLRFLDVSNTDVKDIATVAQLPGLKTLKADNCIVANIDFKVPGLDRFYADGSLIDDQQARLFLEKNPHTILVYKTRRLNQWWNALPPGWKEIFERQAGTRAATPEMLHRLIASTRVTGEGLPVGDLDALGEFIRLREVHLSGVGIATVTPQPNLKDLKSLHIKGSPLLDVESLTQFRGLEELDISNTPVEDILPLGVLENLKSLNCSGTQIRRIDAVARMLWLEHFDCSNTNVSKLDAIMGMPLKSFRCYNTKISEKTIERFKAAHPDCKVVHY